MTEAELIELFNSVPTDAELMAMFPTESDTDDMVADFLEHFDERDHWQQRRLRADESSSRQR